MDVGECLAEKGDVGADNVSHIGENHHVDVDVCVHLCEIVGCFPKEEFCIPEEKVFNFVAFAFDWWNESNDAETQPVLGLLKQSGELHAKRPWAS